MQDSQTEGAVLCQGEDSQTEGAVLCLGEADGIYAHASRGRNGGQMLQEYSYPNRFRGVLPQTPRGGQPTVHILWWPTDSAHNVVAN